MNNSMEGSKSVNSTNSGERSTSGTQELRQLQQSLTKQHQKNRLRYQNLKKQGVNFGFQIFSPVIFPIDKIHPSNYEHTKIQLLSNVDRLFKESEQITKIEMKHLNDKHQQSQIQQNLEYKISNSYLFLRKALNVQEVGSLSSEDRLDRLNKIIGTLKGGAQHILKQTEVTNKIIMMKDEEILSHPLCEKLKQNLQKSTMRLQDQRQKFQEQLQTQIQQKQEFRKQNNLLRKQIQSYKVKVRSLEMEVAEYLNKVNTLTQKLFQSTHKKTIKEEKGVKYFGSDFQIDIKSTKQFKLNYENQLVKRTLQELQQFIQGYSYSISSKQMELSQTKGSQNIDTNQMFNTCSESQQKQSARRSLGNKRVNRNSGATRNLIAPGDPQNITKVRFTRTSTLVNNPRLEAEIVKEGYIRTRTDSYRH